MSFAEKVHARLLALESQVQALDKRLKALEPRARVEAPVDVAPIQVVMKRKPGRPRKEANV